MNSGRWIRSLKVAAFLAVVVVGLPWMASGERASLAVPTKGLNLMLYDVGLERGIYRDEGIDLKILLMKGALSVSAIVAGELDYTISITPAIMAAMTRAPVRVIAITSDKPIFFLMAKPTIHSVAELKGKRVGISSFGGSLDLLTRVSLNHFGLDPERDVKIFPVGSTSLILAALKEGSIDGGLLSPPFNAEAKVRGFRELLYTGDIAEMAIDGLAANTRKIKEGQAGVKRMLRGTLKSIQFMREHREEMIGFIMKNFKLEREVAAIAYDSTLKTISQDGEASRQAIQAHLNQAKAAQKVTTDIPPSALLDFSLLAEAQKELGITPRPRERK